MLTQICKTVEVSNEPQESNFLSIVDRIKNDITTLKTISKQGTTTAVNVYMQQVLSRASVFKSKYFQYLGENFIEAPEKGNGL